LENVINRVKTELASCRSAFATGHPETSGVRKRELPRTVGRQVLPSHDRNRNLYSTVTAGCVVRKYKLMIRSKDYHPPGTIKKLLKFKVNPTEIKGRSPHLNRLETEDS